MKESNAVAPQYASVPRRCLPLDFPSLQHTDTDTTSVGVNCFQIQRSTLQFYDSRVASRVAASMKRRHGVVDLRGKSRVLVLKPHIFPGSEQACYKVCNNPFCQRSVLSLEERSGRDEVMGVGKT